MNIIEVALKPAQFDNDFNLCACVGKIIIDPWNQDVDPDPADESYCTCPLC